MKRCKWILPALLCAAMLLSCGFSPVTQQTEPSTVATVPTALSSAEPTVTEAPTEPPHSEYYIPGVSVEDVILYFNEVCLNAEYVNSGDPTVLQKWTEPLVYRIHGTATQEDRDTLESFALWLNHIPGFPGIWEAPDLSEANVNIHFCSLREMVNILGDNFWGADGGVTFWYENDAIYQATVCYRNDIDQYLRNSVILEEIYNGLGPIQDTALRSDSIIYTEFSQPQDLTDIDRLILQLLYHPDIKCGMDREECAEVIRRLYY